LLLGDVREAVESLRALEPRPELPAIRLESRRTLLQSIESQVGCWQQDKTLLEKDVLYRQAYQFLSAPTGPPSAGTERRYGPWANYLASLCGIGS
jgi:hypothetical protein